MRHDDTDGEEDTIVLANPRKEDFTQINNAIMNDTRLSVNARFLFLQLFQFAWKINAQGVFPGHRQLSIRMRIRRRRLQDYMDELKDAGLIKVRQRGVMRTNIYTIYEKVNDDYVGLPPFDPEEVKFTRPRKSTPEDSEIE
jgi:hypothetical protein